MHVSSTIRNGLTVCRYMMTSLFRHAAVDIATFRMVMIFQTGSELFYKNHKPHFFWKIMKMINLVLMKKGSERNIKKEKRTKFEVGDNLLNSTENRNQANICFTLRNELEKSGRTAILDAF